MYTINNVRKLDKAAKVIKTIFQAVSEFGTSMMFLLPFILSNSWNKDNNIFYFLKRVNLAYLHAQVNKIIYI